jgi:RecB family endonuclease NucS
VRIVIARCSVDYAGRLTAHLASALRLLIVKADGSVLVHSDGGSWKRTSGLAWLGTWDATGNFECAMGTK